jgi:hypothetical protein
MNDLMLLAGQFGNFIANINSIVSTLIGWPCINNGGKKKPNDDCENTWSTMN